LKSRPVCRAAFLAEHSDFNTFYKIWITRIDANETEPQPLCSGPPSADHGRCSGDRNEYKRRFANAVSLLELLNYNTRRVLKMRLRFFACLLSVLIASAVFPAAQEPVKPALSPRIITATKQVTIFNGLEKQLLQSVQKKDKAAAQAMLTEDLYIEMPDADPLPGDDWLASVMAKDYALKSFVVRQMSAIDLGNAVVVKFDRLQEAVSKGKADSGEFFVVDVWKKDGDNWKLASRYVSKVSSQPSMPKAPVKPTGKQ
jgi:hypothetical protein